MTETTNQTAKYSKNYSGDVGETPKPMTGTWHLEAPDGRRWSGSGPLNCVAQEISERVPVQVQLARVLAIADEPDLDERHAKLGVEYGTVKVDELVDKLQAERDELRAKLDELARQEHAAFVNEQGFIIERDDMQISSGEKLYLAAGARPVEPAPADDVLEALDLNPEQFRTEGGTINRGKLRAAIRYPEKYLQPEHWMRAEPAPAAQDDANVQPSTCTWSLDDEDEGTWASSCGELWLFNEGGPKENRVKYCHHCGKPVDVARAADIFGDAPQPSQEPPPLKPMCCRCYDESDDLLPANCSEKPELLTGAPLGMYHCPDCGAMVCAGFPHGPLCRTCHDRKHPGFDCDHTSAADKKEPT